MIAGALQDWLPLVIQASSPHMVPVHIGGWVTAREVNAVNPPSFHDLVGASPLGFVITVRQFARSLYKSSP